jgi:RNA polymerase sigma-70 factor, ECF subfamily
VDAKAAEGAVLAIAKAQDRQAFAQLFAFYAPRVKGYMVKRGVEMSAADELVQDVMLALWTKARYYNPERGSVSTWIFTVARNTLIDRVRRERRPEIDPSDPTLSDSPHSPDEIVERGRYAITIREAMTDLPTEQADVVTRVYGEGQSLADVANATSTPLGTVKTRMRLALARLRTHMPARET